MIKNIFLFAASTCILSGCASSIFVSNSVSQNSEKHDIYKEKKVDKYNLSSSQQMIYEKIRLLDTVATYRPYNRKPYQKTQKKDLNLSDDVIRAFNGVPGKEDADNDGLNDNFEIMRGYPYLQPDKKDTNSNGIDDAKDDQDGDGLTNLEEYQYMTSPINPDTDGDGLSDKVEVYTTKTNPNTYDSDKDGISDDYDVLLSAESSSMLLSGSTFLAKVGESQFPEYGESVLTSSGLTISWYQYITGSGQLEMTDLRPASDMYGILTNLNIPKDIEYLSISGFSKYVTREQLQMFLPISIQAYLDPSTFVKQDLPAFRIDEDRVIVDMSQLDDVLAFISTAQLSDQDENVVLAKVHTGEIESQTYEQTLISKEQELALFGIDKIKGRVVFQQIQTPEEQNNVRTFFDIPDATVDPKEICTSFENRMRVNYPRMGFRRICSNDVLISTPFLGVNAINNNYVNGFMIVQSADATENGILFFSNVKDDGIFLPESQSTELYITAEKNVYEWSATGSNILWSSTGQILGMISANKKYFVKGDEVFETRTQKKLGDFPLSNWLASFDIVSLNFEKDQIILIEKIIAPRTIRDIVIGDMLVWRQQITLRLLSNPLNILKTSFISFTPNDIFRGRNSLYFLPTYSFEKDGTYNFPFYSHPKGAFQREGAQFHFD